MSRKVIVVEGAADEKFIIDYLKYLGIYNEQDWKISVNGGCAKNNPAVKDALRVNKNDGGTNLIIFDADNDCEKRREEIQKNFNEYVDKENVFLFPDNQSNGCLETLLERIAVNTEIFDCWKKYEDCLKCKNTEYTTPSLKSKMYAYLEAQLPNTNSGKEKIKDGKRDYTNKEHWNLAHEALNPLKEFLTTQLITN
jgi:hypothetical protein